MKYRSRGFVNLLYKCLWNLLNLSFSGDAINLLSYVIRIKAVEFWNSLIETWISWLGWYYV